MKKRIQQTMLVTTCMSLSLIGMKAQTLDWAGKFGGIGEDVVRELYVDAAGTTYTTGYFTDEANFAVMGTPVNLTSNGFYDVFVQKTDASGNLVWARSFGSDSFEYGTAIIADADGNVYISGVFDQPTDFDPGTGSTILTSNGGQDMFLVKLNASGDFVWAKNMGGDDYDESTSLGVDAAGNVYLSGYFNGTADFDPGAGTYEFTCMGMNDNVLAKYSSDGDLIWAKQYGSAGFEAALSMRVLADGTSYTTGFYSGTADFDPGLGTFEMSSGLMQNSGYLLQLDNNGDFVMARNIVSTGNVISYDVDTDASGNIYLTGTFGGTIDLDPGTGTSEYTTVFDNSFVVKLDAAGDFVWGKHIASDETVIAYSVDVNGSGNVTLSGYMETTTDFNPDPTEIFELTPAPENAMGAYICVLDNNGDFVQAAGYGGCGFVDYHGAYSDAAGNLYISGAFETTVDVNPDPAVEQLVTVDDFRDNYLIKLEALNVGITDQESLLTLNVYPNPAEHVLHIVTDGHDSEVLPVALIDNSGRVVLRTVLMNGQAQVDVSALKGGLYQVKIGEQRAGTFVRK